MQVQQIGCRKKRTAIFGKEGGGVGVDIPKPNLKVKRERGSSDQKTTPTEGGKGPAPWKGKTSQKKGGKKNQRR